MIREHGQTMKSRNVKSEVRTTSTRVAKVASSVQRSIQESLLRGLEDPRIRGLISITGVDVSPDLADARVKVSVVPDKYELRVIRGLQSAAGRLRSEIGNHARIRRVPRLTFEIDRSMKRQAELEALVRDDDPNLDSEGAQHKAPRSDKEASGT